MKQFGWLLLVGGGLLAVVDFLMLVMQAEMWLTGGASWPPMGLSVFLGETFNTGWIGLDKILNSRIPTWLIAIATLIGIPLAILGMKIIDKAD